MQNIFPLRDRVLIKKDEAPEKTQGGLFIPEMVREQRQCVGEVIAVGEGITDTLGIFTPTSVKVGQKVIFPKYTGVDAKSLGDRLCIIPESELLGVIDS